MITTFDQFWRSPNFPMWLTLAAAGFFAIVLLVTLLRAERSVANGALTVITLLAIGVAVAATVRGFGGRASSHIQSASGVAPLPALSCIDDLAGETALAACEKILFGSPDSVAAAVAYASGLISRLTALGDVAAANNVMTPEIQALRRSVERDRYGLMAFVLSVRDRCQPAECPAYKSLTDHNQIAANMDERIYESAIIRYAASWTSPPAGSAPAIAALPTVAPSGKPTNADFPSSTSIPAVNIMTPEPSASAAPRAAPPVAPSPPPRQASAPSATPAAAAAKKQSAPKRAAAPAPVQLTPAPAPSAASTAAPATAPAAQ